MSAVLPDNAPPVMHHSPGLWVLAWRRLLEDRVGMICLVVVVVYLAMMLASFGGVIARDWNKEKGVSYANPSFLAGAENLEAKEVTNKDAASQAKPVDLSDIDPLAPRYKEWEERAARIALTETKRAESLPFGGDKWGRDVLAKAVKGSEVSIFVGSFLLEVFFSIPGLGREIVTAVNRSDFPVIKAVTVYLAMLTMIVNLLVDVMYKLVDPRVSFK